MLSYVLKAGSFLLSCCSLFFLKARHNSSQRFPAWACDTMKKQRNWHKHFSYFPKWLCHKTACIVVVFLLRLKKQWKFILDLKNVLSSIEVQKWTRSLRFTIVLYNIDKSFYLSSTCSTEWLFFIYLREFVVTSQSSKGWQTPLGCAQTSHQNYFFRYLKLSSITQTLIHFCHT